MTGYLKFKERQVVTVPVRVNGVWREYQGRVLRHVNGRVTVQLSAGQAEYPERIPIGIYDGEVVNELLDSVSDKLEDIFNE